MNILTVIPLTRSKMTSALSYFTSSDVPAGAVVSIPLRKKTVHGIVAESRAAEDLKTEIRKAPYEIRKLGTVKAGAFFSSGFIEAAKILAEYHASTVGSIIDALVPDIILENAHKIAPPLPLQATFLGGAPAPTETYAVQADDADRLSAWRSLIRQEFARKKSLAVYVPTAEDARQIFAGLEKGIEGYIFLLHGGLAKKKIIDAWEAIAENKHPVVIVATASFVVLPRGDIESIVLERENGRGWISQRMPYLDLRHALELVARRERRTVYIADALLRAETLYRMERQEISTGSPFKWRSVSTATDALIDMKRPVTGVTRPAEAAEDSAPAAKFHALSPELRELVGRTRDESAHLFILAARRGLSPVTVCDDCQQLVSCKACSAPVVLHASRETGRNYFMCHKCGARRSADELCATCGGHRLSPLGVGADRVFEEVKEAFPDIEAFRIDADATSTEKQISDMLDRWRARPGSVLIGTETALTHLSGTVDHAAVASLDSWLALPDFRMQERIMYALIRLRNIATRSVLVQTRRAGEKVFEHGLKGNLSEFYHAVLAERKQFDYPPFSVLIKITMSGKKDVIARQMGELQAHLVPHEIDVFPAFTASVRGASVIHGLIKLPAGHWPDRELAEKLRALPPNVSVKVDPESLL